MNFNIFSGDSTTERSSRVSLHAMVASSLTLIAAIWAVPGVPGVVKDFIEKNWLPILFSAGIPSFVTSLLWNLARKDVPNTPTDK